MDLLLRNILLTKNDKLQESSLRKFLEDKSRWRERQKEYEEKYNTDWQLWYKGYDETICEKCEFNDIEDCDIDLNYIDENENYSYIYKVGVLSLFDSNKSDFGEFHIGIQSDKDGEMLYLGKLEFEDGENMDIPNTIKRLAYSMLKCWL